MKNISIIISLLAICLAACSENDTPQMPKVTITTTSAAEGTDAVFVIKLDKPWKDPISISVVTQTGTAGTADFTPIASPQLVTFTPGVIINRIYVPIVLDTITDVNETFTLVAADPFNVTIATPQVTETITDVENDYYLYANFSGSEWNAITAGPYAPGVYGNRIIVYHSVLGNQRAFEELIFEFTSPPTSTGTFSTKNGPPTSSSDVTIYYSFNVFDMISDTDWKRSRPGGTVTITNYDSEKKIVTGTFSATLVGTVTAWFVNAEGKFKVPIVE